MMSPAGNSSGDDNTPDADEKPLGEGDSPALDAAQSSHLSDVQTDQTPKTSERATAPVAEESPEAGPGAATASSSGDISAESTNLSVQQTADDAPTSRSRSSVSSVGTELNVRLSSESKQMLCAIRAVGRDITERLGIDMEAVDTGTATDEQVHLWHEQLQDGLALKAASDTSPVERELHLAVRDQFGALGVSVGELRTYLEVSIDIDDAVDRGELPRIDEARYAAYRKVHALVMYGPQKSEEEWEWLQGLVEQEVLEMPWPSTVIRRWQQQRGDKLHRMRRSSATLYNQVRALLCGAAPAVRAPCILLWAPTQAA